MTTSDRRPPYVWLALLGVLSGAPYGIVNEALAVVWAKKEWGAATITAVVSDAGWPWALKFLWAPLIDRFGSRQSWMAGGAGALALLLVVLSIDGGSNPTGIVPWIVFAIALVSATQDVAIDGYGVEALPQKALGLGNGVRVMAYRGGLLLFGGLLAGRVIAWGSGPGWLLGAVFFGLAAVAVAFSPRVPRTARSPSLLREPIRRLVAHRDFVTVVTFVLLFKACDYAMPGALTKAYLVKAGIDAGTIANVLTPIAIGATVAGAMLGGLITMRIGIFKALWILGAFQALSNLAYAGAAWNGSTSALYAAAIFEPFCSGLGTAPFLAFLMVCCDRSFAATHFALWSALMAVGRWGFGRWSGAAAEHFGYVNWFALTFLAAIPAFAILPLIRRRLDLPTPSDR